MKTSLLAVILIMLFCHSSFAAEETAAKNLGVGAALNTIQNAPGGALDLNFRFKLLKNSTLRLNYSENFLQAIEHNTMEVSLIPYHVWSLGFLTTHLEQDLITSS